MEKKIKTLFDYQIFENNTHLSKLIKQTESDFAKELSDEELSFVNAAGSNTALNFIFSGFVGKYEAVKNTEYYCVENRSQKWFRGIFLDYAHLQFEGYTRYDVEQKQFKVTDPGNSGTAIDSVITINGDNWATYLNAETR